MKTKFKPPTLNEIEWHCKNLGIGIDYAKVFHDFHSARKWKCGKTYNRDWLQSLQIAKYLENERQQFKKGSK